MRLPPLRPYFRGGIECYIIFALLVAQDEVATSASMLPWGVEFYLIFALYSCENNTNPLN